MAGAIGAVRAALHPALPILLTCRTAREGGGADLPPAAVARLLAAAAAHPGVAAVDVEQDLPDGLAERTVAIAHERGLPAVVSFHDLAGTPSRAEIVARLLRQEALGADVVKLACTPRTPEDVLVLLGATAEYAARPGARPAITMAMGPLGVVSRARGRHLRLRAHLRHRRGGERTWPGWTPRGCATRSTSSTSAQPA